MKRLRAHDWPGNVRELENILTVAFSLRGDALVIEEEHLDLAPRNQSVGSGGYHRQVDALRKRLLREALDEAGGNQSKAARGLGLSRQALSYLVKQLELF